jgi:5-carboxymethyl-2-hydroxymuconate isomerase
MPHIYLEASENLTECANAREILEQLSSLLASFETIDSASIKAYFHKREVWVTGVGATPGYVHCQVAILVGRPLELRKQIASEFANLIRNAFGHSIESGLAKVTIELREMDPQTYVK